MITHPSLTTEEAKKYVNNWRDIGTLLETESGAYLRGMTDDENRRVVKRIFSHIHTPVYCESGLLEQQQWFAKLHK